MQKGDLQTRQVIKKKQMEYWREEVESMKTMVHYRDLKEKWGWIQSAGLFEEKKK